jgi:hypothetical protein
LALCRRHDDRCVVLVPWCKGRRPLSCRRRRRLQ